MRYRRTFPFLAVALLLPFALAACQQASGDASIQKLPSTQPEQTSMSCTPVERVEVVHFHGTQQCASCIAVGAFAKKTLEESFPTELQSGRIVFKDVNAELTENSAIVQQYQARGSSLFVNAVSQGQDHIEEDATVWRLTTNEEQYKQYFEQKIRSLLTCAS
jgi:hypothetical protein